MTEITLQNMLFRPLLYTYDKCMEGSFVLKRIMEQPSLLTLEYTQNDMANPYFIVYLKPQQLLTKEI